MKSIKTGKIYFFYFLIFCLIIGKSSAQPVSCSDFTITGFSPNPNNASEYLISMQFNGSANQIINYPFFPFVFNGNGDTIASGSMFFFGQLGGTVQDYPVTPVNNTLQPPFTALLIYGTDNGEDTCYLSFPPSAGIAEPGDSDGIISMYPNPASDQVFIREENSFGLSVFTLVNVAGIYVLEGIMASDSVPVAISHLPAGVYFLVSRQEGIRPMKLIKK
jgi:hypothetical protein